MCAYMSLSAPAHARMVIDPAPDMPQNADEGRHDLDRLSLIPPAHLGPITSAHISALLPHLYSPVASGQSDAQCPPSQRGWIPLCDSGAKNVYAVGYCGMIVAIKHAHAHDAETRSHFSRTLVKEAQALTQARHPNIVQLMGTTRVAGNPALVLEHVGPSLGDLLGRLSLDEGREAAVVFSWQTRVHLAADAAKGLAYLHGSTRLKLTGFSYVRPVFDVTWKEQELTERARMYAAPEILRARIAREGRRWHNGRPNSACEQGSAFTGSSKSWDGDGDESSDERNQPSPKTDMFSYGVVLASIGACALASDEDGIFTREWDMEGPDPDEVRIRLRANLNATTSPAIKCGEKRPHAYPLASMIAEVAVACTRADHRPDAMEVVEALRAGLDQYDMFDLNHCTQEEGLSTASAPDALHIYSFGHGSHMRPPTTSTESYAGAHPVPPPSVRCVTDAESALLPVSSQACFNGLHPIAPDEAEPSVSLASPASNENGPTVTLTASNNLVREMAHNPGSQLAVVSLGERSFTSGDFTQRGAESRPLCGSSSSSIKDRNMKNSTKPPSDAFNPRPRDLEAASQRPCVSLSPVQEAAPEPAVPMPIPCPARFPPHHEAVPNSAVPWSTPTTISVSLGQADPLVSIDSARQIPGPDSTSILDLESSHLLDMPPFPMSFASRSEGSGHWPGSLALDLSSPEGQFSLSTGHGNASFSREAREAQSWLHHDQTPLASALFSPSLPHYDAQDPTNASLLHPTLPVTHYGLPSFLRSLSRPSSAQSFHTAQYLTCPGTATAAAEAEEQDGNAIVMRSTRMQKSTVHAVRGTLSSSRRTRHRLGNRHRRTGSTASLASVTSGLALGSAALAPASSLQAELLKPVLTAHNAAAPSPGLSRARSLAERALAQTVVNYPGLKVHPHPQPGASDSICGQLAHDNV